MSVQAAATSVTVFGGGVAGLTAAHELAERGLRVLLVDPALPLANDTAKLSTFELEEAEGEERRYDIAAGEQGPFYVRPCDRHLLDSLRRIPLEPGSSRSVADSLVKSRLRALSGGALEPLLLLPRSVSNASELYVELRQLLASSFSTLDVQMLFVRALRYVTSCSARRAKDCQTASLVDYLSGVPSQAGLPAFQMSDSALARIARESLLVSGVEAERVDARCALNALLQLHTATLSTDGSAGGALPGSIEDTWLRSWRQHLQGLGVRFERGTLKALSLPPGGKRVQAEVHWHGAAPPEEIFPSDYQLIATDVVTAERVTRPLKSELGVIDALQGLTTVLSGDPRKPSRSRHVARDPSALSELGSRPWDRLKAVPHVDFFLSKPVPELDGCTYLVDAEWSIECTSMPVPEHLHARAAERPTCVVRAKLWSFTVADGSWTAQRLAHDAWHQIEQALAPNAILEKPLAYRVDERLEPGSGALSVYRRAWFAPIAGDWDRRPDGEPRAAVEGSPQPASPQLWSDGGYLVHHGSLIFAGPYLRTFTRSSDAESANESARHAVNAILAHRASLGIAHDSARGEPSPARCQSWNPELHEPAPLQAAKQLDEQLSAQGLPHLFDLLGLELLPRLASQSGPPDDQLLRLLALFDGFTASAAEARPEGATTNKSSILDALKNIRRYLEQQTQKGAGVASGDPQTSKSTE
jgi:hypothetical protein